MRTPWQSNEDISKYTLTGKVSIAELRDITAKLYKRKKFENLDVSELDKVADAIKEFYENRLKNPNYVYVAKPK